MKRFAFFFTSLVLFISIPFLTCAQEKEPTLEEVVVTATRDAQEIRKVPANVTVITEEEISQSNARSVVDLLRDEVGVLVRDYYGTGKNATVDVRGFGETGPLNTLVLVDGRRANAIDLSGVDWTQIPLDQIERIEIVRGASSVLYGDNAVGGVVNIITKKPEKALSAGAQGALGSYHYHKESGSVGGKWGPLSAMLNVGYQATEGYRDNGFFRAKDVGGKVIYDLNEQISLNFNGGFHRDDSGLPGGLPKPIYEQDRRATISPNDKAETDDFYLTSGIKAKLWEMGRIEADLSYRHREVSDFFRSYDFEDRRNLTTWGFTPRYILDKPLWGHGHKLTAGLDYYSSDSNVDSEYTFLGTVTYDRLKIKKKSTGLYALDEFSILENLILSLGGRYEWVNYEVHQTSTNKGDKVREAEPAWTLGLDYLFGKKSSAFLSAKRSFRFPVSDELIQFFPVFQANPLMKPQVGYDYEAGIRHAFSDQIVANLTLFWIDIQDEIFYNPLTFSNENYPKTRRQGVEVGVRAKPFEWLLVWGNYAYVKPKLREGPFSGSDIPGAPRNKGSAGTEIDFGKGFLLNVKANIVGSQYFISDWANQFEHLDPYYTLDARFSYTWRGLKAFVGVNNLTNQKFSEYGVVSSLGTQYFYSSPERNVIGGVSYTF